LILGITGTPPEAGSTIPTRDSAIEITHVPIDSLKTEPPFNELFAIDSEVRERIYADMKRRGYLPYEPIRTWNDIVVDGHTKLLAARKAGIKTVPVVRLSFASVDEALDDAIAAQTVRRNLRDADYLKLVEKVDQRQGRGGKRGDQQRTSGEVFASATETAQKLSISKTRVENARAVLDAENETIRKAVEDGTLSLHRAAQQARAAKDANHEDPRQLPLNLDMDPAAPAGDTPPVTTEEQDSVDEKPAKPTPTSEPETSALGTAAKRSESCDREEPETPDADEEQQPVTPPKTRKAINAEDSPAPSGADKAPDLDGILKALESIMRLVGDNADLQARFTADIAHVKGLILEGGAAESEGASLCK